MNNEKLVLLVQTGDKDALLTLWVQVRRLAWKFIPRWRRAAEAGGLTVEDLEQVGFLALLRAVNSFDPGRGCAFSTCFTTALKAEVFAAAGIRTEKQSRDPLRQAVSLDVSPGLKASEEIALVDLIEDPAAEAAIEGTGLRLAVQDIVAELPEEQRAALYRRYWLDLPPREVDRKAHDAALRALRHPSRSRRLRELVRQSD